MTHFKFKSLDASLWGRNRLTSLGAATLSPQCRSRLDTQSISLGFTSRSGRVPTASITVSFKEFSDFVDYLVEQRDNMQNGAGK